MNNRFYANVQGPDANAILACLKKANEIIQNDTEITCIVLYSYTKSNFCTVAQIFGDDNVERMFSYPLQFKGIAKQYGASQNVLTKIIINKRPLSSVVI